MEIVFFNPIQLVPGSRTSFVLVKTCKIYLPSTAESFKNTLKSQPSVYPFTEYEPSNGLFPFLCKKRYLTNRGSEFYFYVLRKDGWFFEWIG